MKYLLIIFILYFLFNKNKEHFHHNYDSRRDYYYCKYLNDGRACENLRNNKQVLYNRRPYGQVYGNGRVFNLFRVFDRTNRKFFYYIMYKNKPYSSSVYMPIDHDLEHNQYVKIKGLPGKYKIKFPKYNYGVSTRRRNNFYEAVGTISDGDNIYQLYRNDYDPRRGMYRYRFEISPNNYINFQTKNILDDKQKIRLETFNKSFTIHNI